MSNCALPVSRVPGSRDAPVLRWGIMGPGWIAERFTESVQAHNFHHQAAVLALDAGTLVTEVLGLPEQLRAMGQPHESGVNAQLSATMQFAGGAQAVVNTHVHNFTPTSATIVGSEATLTIDGPFNMPGGFEVRFPDGARLRHEEPSGGHFEGLHYEAAAVARAVAAGQTQACQRTLPASIRTLDVADEIRRQRGVVFPGEETSADVDAARL
ncbi:hypothetical protein QK290_12380 [Pseudarthrobacter sp. AL07]|uniref:hypothetical protein n=1 Tax=unclassified Pseudarthrobacter TaxID=2647000 RepID=UPI00249B8FFF|nr:MULTISPECIES: hypothetical protein [unclassified Pseudarthrobacter]MDI3195214.1 hypothetical protein [Pseudarthrobacter sp. AL20]MDI3209280.1 hypothetical protein [Pseudarthrobacter sp. AL07]